MTLDKELVDALERDYTNAPITPQERVMLDYDVLLHYASLGPPLPVGDQIDRARKRVESLGSGGRSVKA